MTRVHILSDLHLEFNNLFLPKVDADITIIAGDIHVGMKGLQWLKQFRRPVVYILGNHEFYNYNSVDSLRRQFSIQKKVIYLENKWVEFGDIKIFGCTLWTDFNLLGDKFFAYANAKRFLNDFQFIKDVKMKQSHRDSVASIKKFLKQAGKKIVVTHHAPSIQSISPEWRNKLAPAFASNLENLIIDSGIDLWIHGHTHDSCDYMIGSTRVVCNPRGYAPNNINPNFNSGLVIGM